MDNYHIISTLNEEHKIYLVQSTRTGQIYVQKILDVYNIHVYEYLYRNPIAGIPRIINYFEQNHTLVVIEEYISGFSLQEKIDHAELSLSDVKIYMVMLCTILEALHAMTPPIIHRDIKPSNIIITSYNYAVLLDFNAAKQFSDNAMSDTVLLGTPGYAAPEQYGFGSSSPLTDIYSLGIVLKEMLESLSSINNSSADRYNQIITRCTQLSPSARYQSVHALKEAIIAIPDTEISCQHTAYHAFTPADISSAAGTSARPAGFLPPGFRSRTPWKMLFSCLVYFSVFYFCLSIDLKNTYGAKLWLERFFIFLMFLFPVFCGFNYLNMQKLFPLCKSRHRALHYIGIVILDIAIIFFLFIILFIIESLCFPK